MKFTVTALLTGLLAAIPSFAQVGGFGGPSVLTRGTRPAGREGARPIYFSGSLDLSGLYASGLTSVATDGNGGLLDEGSAGAGAGWNLTARRQGRRDNVFVSYSGNYNAFTRATYFSGSSHVLNLTYSHQISRRLTAYVAQAGSTSSNVLSGIRLQSTDEFSAELPDGQGEILDTRYFFLSSAAGLNYQRSARMSFSFSGGFLTQRRHSDSLASSNGIVGTANMSYMVNRRQQIGVSYSYGLYYLSKGFGESSIQTTMLTYGRTLSRRWFFNMGGGVYRSDSERLTQVAVDPFIVLLTGQTTTLEIFRGTRQGFSAQGSLSGRFRRASVDFQYQRGITPGNGVYFIAEQETFGARVGYETTRRWSISAAANVNRFKGVTQQIGVANGHGGSINTSYRLTSLVHFRASVDFNRWDIDNSSFNRNRFLASAGISISPGEVPLSLW